MSNCINTLEQNRSNIAPIPEETEKLAKTIIDAAYKVHSTLGPGLLESVYEKCLIYELKVRGIKFQEQVAVPIIYGEVKIDAGFRIDIIIEDAIIIELKAVESHNPLYEAQLLTYLKLTKKRLGLLINFNVPVIKQGIKRIVL